MTSELGFNWVRGQVSCWYHGSFCEADILPLLSHVPFGGGERFEEVLADERQRESRTCGEVSCINGLGPGGGDRAENSAVQELHEIFLRRHFGGTVSLKIC